MKNIIYAALTLLAIAALFASGIFMLEYQRVQNLCRSAHSRVETVHDAINAIRNYQDDLGPVGRILSQVRQTEAFRNDGYTRDGGWHVEAWTKPLITQGYSVEFAYFNQAVKCAVLDCGAIDVPNCLTLGAN
jgi:hypothetical protein